MAACWIHWLDHEQSELVQSRRNCGYASGDASQRLAAAAGAPAIGAS
jgi:hypothetical protein